MNVGLQNAVCSGLGAMKVVHFMMETCPSPGNDGNLSTGHGLYEAGICGLRGCDLTWCVKKHRREHFSRVGHGTLLQSVSARFRVTERPQI